MNKKYVKLIGVAAVLTLWLGISFILPYSALVFLNMAMVLLSLPFLCMCAALYIKKAVTASVVTTIAAAVIIAFWMISNNRFILIYPLGVVLSLIPSYLLAYVAVKDKKDTENNKWLQIIKVSAIHIMIANVFYIPTLAFANVRDLGAIIYLLPIAILWAVYLVSYGIFSVKITDSVIKPLIVYMVVHLLLFCVFSLFASLSLIKDTAVRYSYYYSEALTVKYIFEIVLWRQLKAYAVILVISIITKLILKIMRKKSGC